MGLGRRDRLNPRDELLPRRLHLADLPKLLSESLEELSLFIQGLTELGDGDQLPVQILPQPTRPGHDSVDLGGQCSGPFQEFLLPTELLQLALEFLELGLHLCRRLGTDRRHGRRRIGRAGLGSEPAVAGLSGRDPPAAYAAIAAEGDDFDPIQVVSPRHAGQSQPQEQCPWDQDSPAQDVAGSVHGVPIIPHLVLLHPFIDLFCPLSERFQKLTVVLHGDQPTRPTAPVSRLSRGCRRAIAEGKGDILLFLRSFAPASHVRMKKQNVPFSSSTESRSGTGQLQLSMDPL